jgi:hypothetical protein
VSAVFTDCPEVGFSVLTLFTQPSVPDVRLSCGSAGTGVHDDLDDQPRRSVYRNYVARGALPAGYATEDGVGLHYVGTDLHEAVSVREHARAWWVEPTADGGFRDKAITARRI